MTVNTEQRIETPAESGAKPPRRTAERRKYGLFQTMDELRTRHEGAPRTKDRVLHVTAALAGGSLLFAALSAVIFFFE